VPSSNSAQIIQEQTMPQHPKQPDPERQAEQDGNLGRPSPETDSTNPMRQESVGKWVPAERNEEKPDEPEA
jgi:hypothetical protein